MKWKTQQFWAMESSEGQRLRDLESVDTLILKDLTVLSRMSRNVSRYLSVCLHLQLMENAKLNRLWTWLIKSTLMVQLHFLLSDQRLLLARHDELSKQLESLRSSLIQSFSQKIPQTTTPATPESWSLDPTPPGMETHFRPVTRVVGRD